MKKILAKSMVSWFLISVIGLLVCVLQLNFDVLAVWIVFGTIGMISTAHLLSLFVDWFFEDKGKKDE